MFPPLLSPPKIYSTGTLPNIERHFESCIAMGLAPRLVALTDRAILRVAGAKT